MSINYNIEIVIKPIVNLLCSNLRNPAQLYTIKLYFLLKFENHGNKTGSSKL